MANDIVQTIAEARVDARSLSEFVFKPADFMVARRLAPSVRTLQYYVDFFNTMQSNIATSVSAAQSSLNNSVAEAQGKVAYIETTVQDAINNTAVEGGVLADTFVVKTANGVGQVARSLREVNSSVIYPEDYGAIGDGNVHTLQGWIDSGRYASLSEVQADFPKVNSLNEYIDKVAIQACNDFCSKSGALMRSVVGSTYVIDSGITLNCNADMSKSFLLLDGNKPLAAVSIKSDDGTRIEYINIKLPSITSTRKYLIDWATGSCGVLLEYARNLTVTFDHVQGFETGFKLFGEGTTLISYCSFFFEGIFLANRTNIHIDCRDRAWLNECSWYNGQFASISTDHQKYPDMRNLYITSAVGGHNPPNGHKFINMSMEGTFYRTIDHNYSGKTGTFWSVNRWIGCRFEGATEFFFEPVAIGDSFIACHTPMTVNYAGRYPNIIADPSRQFYQNYGGTNVHTERKFERSARFVSGASMSSVVTAYGLNSDTMNSTISADGTYSVYLTTDPNNNDPVIKIGRDGANAGVWLGASEQGQMMGFSPYAGTAINTTGNLRPRTEAGYSLGDTSRYWSAIYAINGRFKKSVSFWDKPTINSQPVLGSSGQDDIDTTSKIVKILGDYGLANVSQYVEKAVKGTTEQRPVVGQSSAGFRYFDTTLNKPVYWSGSKWVDAMGSDV